MPVPPFRFAVFTDLHVGATTTNKWHNHFLTDHPEQTIAVTVAAINREHPDFVVVLGDLSDNASLPELSAARGELDRIAAPWIVCQGNHDVTDSGDRSAWDQVFGDRAPIGVLGHDTLPLPDGIRAVALEATFGEVDGQWRVTIAEELAELTLSGLRESRPELLLVFVHFPLIRQSEHVRAYGGKNAGTLWEGESLLAGLTASADTTLFFAGHQHFHHIVTSPSTPRWLHCTTGSQAEYPAEFRIVGIDAAGVSIHTLPGAPDVVAAAPPPQVTWVAGRPEDRESHWPWSSP
jgi:hypothetical protein